MLYNKVRYLIYSSLLFLLSCFPSLAKSPLEIVNLFSFLSNRSAEIQSIENGIATAFVYSKAEGELQIQNLNDEPITISENGNWEIPIQSFRGNGTLDFRILTQPINHECRIINPEENFINGSTIIEINCFSLLSTSPISGGIIPPLTSIVFRFSDTVDFDPTNMSDESFTNVSLDSPGNPDFVLSATLVLNDTLTVTPPAPGWTPGVGKFIEFNFRNLEGKNFASGGKRLDLTIASAIRYVAARAEASDFGNDGLTPAAPFRNIQRAIDDMDPCPDKSCLVLIEEGSYDASAFGDSITMIDGISLSGSYLTGTNFTSRNPGLRNSIIFFPFPPATSCGDLIIDCVPLKANGVNSPTVLEGFTIQSGDSKRTVGLLLQSSNLLVSNNTILSGNASFDSSDAIGVKIIDSNANLRLVTIEAGGCSADNSTSVGLSVTANSVATVTPIIQNSFVYAGNCTTTVASSYGILFQGNAGNSVSLENIAATPIQSGNATEESIGIIGFNSNANIQGVQNITTGDSKIVTGIRITTGISSATIGTNTDAIINITTGLATEQNIGINITASTIANVQNTNLILGNTNSTGTVAPFSIGMNLNVGGAGAVLVSQNSVNMGNVSSDMGNASAFGVRISNSNNSSWVARNSIKMANLNSGTLTGNNYGLQWNGTTSGILENNLIYGGSTNRNAIGISLVNNDQNMKVLHNTVAMGSTTGDPAKSNSLDSGGAVTSGGLELRNNIFLNQPGTETCVNLFGLPTGAIQTNVFWNCTTFVNDTNATFNGNILCGAGVVGTGGCGAGEVSGIGTTFEGNLNANPSLSGSFASPFQLELTSSSPCSVTQNTNYLPSVINDRFLNPRNPPTVSLGALEYTGACIP